MAKARRKKEKVQKIRTKTKTSNKQEIRNRQLPPTLSGVSVNSAK